MTSQFTNMTSSSTFFFCGIVTGRNFMSVSLLVLELWQFSFIRDWSGFRKSEIELSEFFPNIWRLGRIRDSTFGMNVSNKMLLNAAKCQAYSIYRFWVITGKPTGGGDYHLSPPKLGVILNLSHYIVLF